MRSRTLRRGWLLVAFGLLAASCSQSSEAPTVPVAPTTIPAATTTTPAAPTTIPAATTTTIPATTTTPATTTPIPSGWTAYFNESVGFSIFYPDEWEVFTLGEAATDEFFDNLGQALDVAMDPVVVLGVGLPIRGGGFEPNVTIVVEKISAEVGLDAYVAGSKEGLSAAFPSYTSTEQVKAIVGNRDSILLPGSYDLSDLLPGVDGRWSMIQLFVTDNPAGWSVTCGTSESETSALAMNLELCDSVVRTFELSSP